VRARAKLAAQIHHALGLVCGAGGRAFRTFAHGGAAMADMRRLLVWFAIGIVCYGVRLSNLAKPPTTDTKPATSG